MTTTDERTTAHLLHDARQYRPAVLTAGGTQPGVKVADARKVAQAVAAFLSDHGAHALLGQGPQGGDGPFVCGPGFHADGYTIAYEGDYDWPFRLTEYLFTAREIRKSGIDLSAKAAALLDLTDHVHIECQSGWAIALYPL